MSEKEYRDFKYIEKENYDAEIKINGEEIKAYSKKKLKELHEEGYTVLGETYEKKQRDKEKDIGRIELAEKRLFVGKDGSKSGLFRKQSAFVEVEGGGFIAMLKLRLLPFILIGALLLGGVGIGLKAVLGGDGNAEAPTVEDIDPNISPAVTEILTITGTVYEGENRVEGAKLSLQNGNTEIATATTDKDGNYLISNVQDGNYNLVCTNGDSVLTKIATVNGASIIVDFYFPEKENEQESNTDAQTEPSIPETEEPTSEGNITITPKKPDGESTEVKAVVKIADESTPAIAVGGLDFEAMLHIQNSKEVDLTFIAKLLDEKDVPQNDKTAVTAISGDLNLTFYDFSLLKEIYVNHVKKSEEYLKETETVLEIAVPYNSKKAIGTYVFRSINGVALRFEELSAKPSADYRDGTYFVTADTVYIYMKKMGAYVIGSVSGGKVTKGSDTITYKDIATVDLNTNTVSMYYKHDEDSTNSAKVQIYLVGENGNLLIAESGIIPVGYQIESMALLDNISKIPSVGTYNGLMKIIYISDEVNETETNVDIPLSVAITQ